MKKIDGVKFVENVEMINKKISTASELVVKLEEVINIQDKNYKDIAESKVEITELRDALIKELKELEQEIAKSMISNQKQVKNLSELVLDGFLDFNKNNEIIIKKHQKELTAINSTLEQRIIIQNTKVEKLGSKIKINNLIGIISSSIIIMLLIIVIIVMVITNSKI